MTLRSLAGTTALVLSLTSTGLLADVTPEDVWQAWQNASSTMGTTVTSESAVRDGDDYVINGSKIWTSLGDRAHQMILLARTNPDAPNKYAGLSFFLAPMKIPAPISPHW